MHCSEVKPTTPVIATFGGIREKTTKSTVLTKKDIVKLTSTTPHTSTKVTQETTAQPKEPADVRQLKNEHDEPVSMNGVYS